MIPKPNKPLGAPELPVFEVEPEEVGGFAVVGNVNVGNGAYNGWGSGFNEKKEPEAGFQVKKEATGWPFPVKEEVASEEKAWVTKSSFPEPSQNTRIELEAPKQAFKPFSPKAEAWPFPADKNVSKSVLELPVAQPKLSPVPRLEISKSNTVELPPPLTPVKMSVEAVPSNRVGIIPEPTCNGSLVITFETFDSDGLPYVALLGVENGGGRTYPQLTEEIFKKTVRHFQANKQDIETLFNENEEVQFLTQERARLGDLSDLKYEVIDSDSGENLGYYKTRVINLADVWEGVCFNLLEEY